MEFMWGNYLVFGLLATLAMTITMYVAVAAGVPLDLPWMLGLIFFSPGDKALVYSTGFIIQFVNGALFGIIYGMFFVLFGLFGGIWWGMLFGTVHAVLSGIVLGIMPAFHPRIGTGKDKLPVPGYFGQQLGKTAPAALILIHLVYGAIFGSMFNP